MSIKVVTRLASSVVVAGIATLSFATPAHALVADPPGSGTSTTSSTSDGPNWPAIAAGSVAGVALVGAGVATVRTRRHHRQVPHVAA
jgi:hypothetical protein